MMLFYIQQKTASIKLNTFEKIIMYNVSALIKVYLKH
jgi:hypothetical protein